MLRKNAFLPSGLIMAILLVYCKSPTAPSPHGPPIKNYRDRVEVIYTRVMPLAEGKSQESAVYLRYSLYDPDAEPETGLFVLPPTIAMSRIGENKYRAYLKHVFIQTKQHSKSHAVSVNDFGLKNATIAIRIDIEGAISWDFKGPKSAPTSLNFKMGRH
jgi:hypothetical protein